MIWVQVQNKDFCPVLKYINSKCTIHGEIINLAINPLFSRIDVVFWQVSLYSYFCSCSFGRQASTFSSNAARVGVLGSWLTRSVKMRCFTTMQIRSAVSPSGLETKDNLCLRDSRFQNPSGDLFFCSRKCCNFAPNNKR